MNEEMKVAVEAVNEVEEATKSIYRASFGKGCLVAGGVTVLIYLGGKYVVKPLVKKIWKKDTEELEASDVEEIEVAELYSEEE